MYTNSKYLCRLGQHLEKEEHLCDKLALFLPNINCE